MRLSLKILNPEAVVPQYATAGAAGFDLHSVEDVTLHPGETRLIKTGIAMSVPEGFEMQVRPRSGLSLKTNLRVANAPGTVDSDYRGEVCIIMTNTSMMTTERVKAGERVAQGVICPVYQVDFQVVDLLEETARGSGGFGSTGK